MLGVLGTGGMSEIFLGREPSGRLVVIKRILPHLARQPNFVSMFLDEARIGSLIHHPNVVEVYELGQVGLDLFMVMEYLEGENGSSLLRRLVARNDRLSYALAAYIVARACRGMEAAHTQCDEAGKPLALVHRDISPPNVFLTYDGQVKVLDFGIAMAAQRLAQTATGELKGKFQYMSPEQCRGEPLDERSDVFSLGILLWELSTQRQLFSRPNELLVLKAVCEDPIPSPSRNASDYPEFLESMCNKALERDKSRRYATAAAMADELEAAVGMLMPPGADPAKALAEELERLFDDRIAEKRRIARQAVAGVAVGAIPSTEADQSVVVPAAAQYTRTYGTRIRALIRRRIPVSLVAGVVALALFVAVGLPLLLGQDRREAAAAPTAPAPEVRVVEVPVGPAQPPVAADITIRIETKPKDAKVTVEGVEHGKTPIDLTFPRGDSKVRVEVRRRGYHPLDVDVTLDRDQQLMFSLTPKSKKREAGYYRFD